jgi:hypothetical protein
MSETQNSTKPQDTEDVKTECTDVTPFAVGSEPQTEKKVNVLDFAYTLSKEELAKTIVVFSPKNQLSAQQKLKCAILRPSAQNPDAKKEDRVNLSDLKKLLMPGLNEYVKFEFDFPPMKLLSKLCKISGPGINPTLAKGNKKDDGEGSGMQGWSHSFWFVCSTQGMKQNALESEGGGGVLAKKQLEAHKSLTDASIILERKRFDHPQTRADLDHIFKQQMEMYQNISKDPVNPEQVWDNMFKTAISQHEHVKIIANLKPSEGQRDKGVSCISKAWYSPREKPTLEENEEAVKEYIETATLGEEKFKVNADIVAGLRKGLRPRRVPVYGKVDGKMILIPQPDDPCASLVRAGDFVIPRMELRMYSNLGSQGQTLYLQRMIVVSQATNDQNKELEMEEKFVKLDDYQIRQPVKKLKREFPVPVPVPVPIPLTVIVKTEQPVLPSYVEEHAAPVPTHVAAATVATVVNQPATPSAPAAPEPRQPATKKAKHSYMAADEGDNTSFADEYD